MVCLTYEEFVQTPIGTPLADLMLRSIRSYAMCTSLFPLMFRFFPRLEETPMRSTVSLLDWDWRRLPSAIGSRIMEDVGNYVVFKQLVKWFGAPKTTLSLQHVYVFAQSFESQWASRITSRICRHVPISGVLGACGDRPDCVTLEHMFLAAMGEAVFSRIRIGLRLLCRRTVWPLFFSPETLRHSIKGHWGHYVRRCLTELGSPALAYGATLVCQKFLPKRVSVNPLVLFRLANIGAQALLTTVLKEKYFIGKVPVPVKPDGQRPTPLAFQEASSYVKALHVPPNELDSVKSFIEGFLAVPYPNASMRLAMAETLWALKVYDDGMKKGMGDASLLEAFSSQIRRVKLVGGEFVPANSEDSDTTEESEAATPLVVREPSSMTYEGSFNREGSTITENTCPVCMSELKEGDRIAEIIKCGHRFHALCVVDWLWRNPNCPLCRTELDDAVGGKRAPASVCFPFWLNRFDLPRYLDFTEFSDTKQYCDDRGVIIHPDVFAMIDSGHSCLPVGIFDFLIAPLFWMMDLYPSDDRLQLYFKREDEAWRMDTEANDARRFEEWAR